jgi:transcriptional regulator with XRE-family HTH domain
VPAETQIIQLLRQRIRRIRLKQGISQDVFAERLGTSVRYIQQIEGTTDSYNPSIKALTRLAAALETDFFALVSKPTVEELAALANPPKRGKVKRKSQG